MSTHLIKEDFKSLSELVKTLDNRPNNQFMRNENSSHSGDDEFTGTSSYEEAINLLRFGYTDPIAQVKEELKKSKLVTSKIYQSLPKIMPENKVVGFVPNVPNSLLGIPESMIFMDKKHQKRKTLSIIYSFGAPCCVDKDDLIKAGIALITAINIVELSGIQTRLQLGFMPSTSDSENEIIFPTVIIKNYGERFNLQKICFPMIHPSMFRRIGFKYLETCPFITRHYWGYGTVRGVVPKVKKLLEDEKNTYIFESESIIKNHFNVEKILKEMDVLQ